MKSTTRRKPVSNDLNIPNAFGTCASSDAISRSLKAIGVVTRSASFEVALFDGPLEPLETLDPFPLFHRTPCNGSWHRWLRAEELRNPQLKPAINNGSGVRLHSSHFAALDLRDMSCLLRAGCTRWRFVLVLPIHADSQYKHEALGRKTLLAGWGGRNFTALIP